MSEITKEVTVQDAKKELIKSKARKPTKKQAVMAGVLRYEINIKTKLNKIEKTNIKKIDQIKTNLLNLYDSTRDEVMTVITKQFGKDTGAKREDVYVTFGKYSTIDISFTIGNFLVGVSDQQWKDNKKILKWTEKAMSLENEKSKLLSEIDKLNFLLSECNMKRVKRELSEKMSVGDRLSDMEIAVAIVKENSNSIDAILETI